MRPLIGVIYSGEAIFTQRENPDLEYVIPKEGSNVWIDGWVIPKNAAPQRKRPEASIDFHVPTGHRIEKL